MPPKQDPQGDSKKSPTAGLGLLTCLSLALLASRGHLPSPRPRQGRGICCRHNRNIKRWPPAPHLTVPDWRLHLHGLAGYQSMLPALPVSPPMAQVSSQLLLELITAHPNICMENWLDAYSQDAWLLHDLNAPFGTPREEHFQH